MQINNSTSAADAAKDIVFARAGTPPINISTPPQTRRIGAFDLNDADLPPAKLDFEAVAKKARRRKKKKGMKPGAPAVTTIRGFHTPVTSGGEESDYSNMSTPRMTPRMMPQDLPSITSSPAMKPTPGTLGGISALKLQIDTLNLNAGSPRLGGIAMQRVASNASSHLSVMSSTGSDSDKMDSYEVPLEGDFTSAEAASSSNKPSSGSLSVPTDELRNLSLTRKMTADDFEPIRCLGKGSYGTVLLVRQKATGRLFAQKQLRKATLVVHKKLVEQTKTERAILESVNRHPFVVKLYYAFQDHEKLYLILEYAQGGELFHHLAMERMFSEDVAAFYMAEMVLALEHLHRNVGVVYRDLKPENCLLDSEGHLLLTDFGLSKVAVDADDPAGPRCNSTCGTIEYMAPEVITGSSYGTAVDWWSLGALAHDLLTGAPPFQGPNHAKTQEKILRAKLSLPYFLGPDAKDLLTRLLRKEPRRRLGANMPRDLDQIKRHRFFRNIDWKALARRELEPPIRPLVTDPELAENFAREFTALQLSPVVARRGDGGFFGSATATVGAGAGGAGAADVDVDMMASAVSEASTDPFGGFSFVASSSLLECGDWC